MTTVADYIEKRDEGLWIAGTRVSLASIVHGFREGESAETIAQLNAYAEVGGKPNPQGDDILFYQTVNQDDLHEAIQTIVYDTISCVIAVDPIPDQPWLYEVWINNQLVDEVESCDDGPGWKWTKQDHSELELCDAACMDFKVSGAFEAKYWCTPE